MHSYISLPVFHGHLPMPLLKALLFHQIQYIRNQENRMDYKNINCLIIKVQHFSPIYVQKSMLQEHLHVAKFIV
jgi:hypothetical protein